MANEEHDVRALIEQRDADRKARVCCGTLVGTIVGAATVLCCHLRHGVAAITRRGRQARRR